MVNQNKLGNEEKDTCKVQTKYNEVSIVDKYEYKLKTEQMLKLMENGAYNSCLLYTSPSPRDQA